MNHNPVKADKNDIKEKWSQKIRKYKNLFDMGPFSRIPLWLYIFILGLITFSTHTIFVPSDLKVYSCNALNLYLGKGYVDINGSPVLFRTPLFPIMIAMSYWLFGISYKSTYWVIKVFCILNPIVVYAIGKKFFGKKVGFAAALLVLTSYAIDSVSFWHLDAVWPFFVLLSTFFVYLGFEKNKSGYFALAGMSHALAYLVKEVAILFFPLPLLMFFFISDYKKKFFFPKVLLSFLVTFIVILPWLFYLIYHKSSFGVDLIIGSAGGGVLKSIANPSGISNTQNILSAISNNLKSFCMGLWHYYHGSKTAMNQWFTIAPLFIIAWCFVLFGAIRGNKHLRILVLHMILFVPIIYIQGAREMRLGQTLIVFLLSYLAIAISIEAFLKIVSRNIATFEKITPIFFGIIIFCLVIIQTFVTFRNDSGYKAFIKKSLWYEKVFDDNNDTKTYGDLTIANDKNFLKIISRFSTPPNKLYMAITNRSLAKESYFNLKGQHPIYYLKSQMLERKRHFRDEPHDHKDRPVYITVFGNSINAVYEYQLSEMINKDITHVLVESYNPETGGNKGLNRYFSSWKAFKRIPLLSDEFNIYEVISKTSPAPDLPPIIDIDSLKTIISKSMEKSKPNIPLLKKCFKILYPSNPCGFLENKSLDSVFASEEKSQKVSLLNKAGMNSLYDGKHEQAIESFKQAICIDPDFAETYKNLFFANALFERQKAISLNPENPIAYYHYAIFLNTFEFYDTALINVKKAISLDPNNAEAYALLGSLYEKQNKYLEAINSYQQAIPIYEKFVEPRKKWRIYTIYLLIGDAYLQLDNTAEAKIFYEQAFRADINPKLKLEAYYKLGILCQRLNEHQSAIAYFQKAVRLNPNFAEAYYSLSQSHLLHGDRKSAIKQYKELRKIDPSLADRFNKEFAFPFK